MARRTYFPDRYPSQGRDTSITVVCAWCNKEFHPWRRHAATSKYCSAACRARGALAQGHSGDDYAATPMPVRPAAASLDPQPTLRITDFSAASNSGDEWRESGEHWDRLAAWWSARQAASAKRHIQRVEAGELAYNTLGSEGRTITMQGFGASLHVKNGALQVTPGRAYSTQSSDTEMLYRGLHGVSCILWLVNGGAGSLSIEALKWCAHQNITVRLLTTRGVHMATLFPSPDAPQALGYPAQENHRADVALRCAQYALAPTGRDIPLARRLIVRKMQAQLDCLNKHRDTLPEYQRGKAALEIGIAWLSQESPTPGASTLAGIRLYEARASNGYYSAWRGMSLRLDERAQRSFPPPWRTIAERKSPLTRWMSPRQATNPAQAMLNFCYSMLESQVRGAINAAGLDSVCGILHQDRRDYRDSLVYDVMEPLRGPVDDLLLQFIAAHTFSSGDFTTMTTGQVVIHPSLCRVLAEMVRLPQRRADDEARWLRAQLLGNGKVPAGELQTTEERSI